MRPDKWHRRNRQLLVMSLDPTQSWNSTDDVLICDDKIKNKDENGESASVTLLR
jgi:hypothetical protein